MLKMKIAAFLLSITITGGFIAREIASQTVTKSTTKNRTKLPTDIGKAQIKCDVQAYNAGIASDEPKNFIVRAKPAKTSAILKDITTKEEFIYYISGSDGKGWFEISKIETTGGDVEETLFEGRGWVHSSLVSTSVAASDAKLYAAPQKKSRVLKKLVADESQAQPIACQGDWMKIKSGKSIGWLSREGQCANPLTTCS